MLKGLDRSVDHLLLFSPGVYAADPGRSLPWEGAWPPETQRQYDAYQLRLAAFPVRAEIAGPAQYLPSAAPVAPDDRMVLATIPHQ